MERTTINQFGELLKKTRDFVRENKISKKNVEEAVKRVKTRQKNDQRE